MEKAQRNIAETLDFSAKISIFFLISEKSLQVAWRWNAQL